MVLRTSTHYLILGVVAVNLVLLLPTVTHSYTISQESDDGDLVFVDELNHHRHSRSTSDEQDTTLRKNPSPPNKTIKSVSDDPAEKTVPIIGNNDEGLPQALVNNKRPKRQFAFAPIDDEELDYGSGDEDYEDEGSAQGSVPSGLYRAVMRVDGPFLAGYTDKNSVDFANLAIVVEFPLQELLKQLPGLANARLSRIRRSNTPGQLELLVDITHASDRSEKERIRDIVNELSRPGVMAPLTNVVIESFSEEQDPYKNYCGSNQVLCPSGTCATRCDGVPECPDFEDELQCDAFDGFRTIATPVEVDLSSTSGSSFERLPPFLPPLVTTTTPAPECSSDQFKCRDDGTCIEDFYRCDSNDDCLDGSDESPSVCGGCLPGQHTCTVDDKCLPDWVTCDGTNDCRDGSDENLQKCCIAGFWCDGVCMDISVNCNGLAECRDKTDEMNCPQLPVTCRADQFRCTDGLCIEHFQRCDKAQDCRGAEDEENCPCQSPNFECISGMCITENKHCDGYDDCDDGSDEFNCQSGSCVTGEFECSDGSCVPLTTKCDGLYDCFDASDEQNCHACGETEFECSLDGRCIPTSERCNGVANCYDESDESNCETDRVCPPGQFRCDVGSCIPISQRCDGTYHCPDATDEDECECRPDQFQCRDTSCIPGTQKCDGTPNCYDGSDEQDCAAPACGVGELQCQEGTCLPEYLRCDGAPHCPDRSDEADCPAVPCAPGEWTCGDGSCIPAYLKCDGAPHCSDRSDESDCPVAPSCGTGEWTCGDGSCIPAYLKCDGAPHCSDRSDESDCPVAPACGVGEWQCQEGTCLPEYLRCDGAPHCPDRSDEADCPAGCGAGQWQCADGNCLPQYLKCDGAPHCPDGSDETDCQPACDTTYEWQCDYGTCISLARRCDGNRDCPSDYSDETDCPQRCRSDQFVCNDGTCLDLSQRCNNVEECRSGEDERSCPYGPSPGCTLDQFECGDGTCVRGDRRCDGFSDCLDDTDESGCLNRTCTEDEFTCEDGECIDQRWRCDQVADCYDGTDELSCSCIAGEFSCDNGQCVDEGRKCDGINDCGDNSDEAQCESSRPCPGGDTEFRCSSGECILKSELCDGYDDCENGEDEEFCESIKPITPGLPTIESYPTVDRGYGSCRPDEFQCGDGECLSSSVRCNGAFECTDGFDELSCPRETCTADEFQCDTGECLPLILQCDGRYDCLDATDELVCGPEALCNEHEFACNNGECVSRRVVCDLYPDCLDKSDEMFCGPSAGERCVQDEEYQCFDGTCIPSYLRCDNQPDCGDNSDEIDCPSYAACSQQQFQCDDGQCVSARVRCDGRPDCFDHSDEMNCGGAPFIETTTPSTTTSTTTTTTTTTTPAPPPASSCTPYYQFTCRSGQCVNAVGYCDGRRDCDDSSDEEGCPQTPRPFPPFPPYQTTPVTAAPPTTRPPWTQPTTPVYRPPALPDSGSQLDRFSCNSGQTIPRNQECDGITDCHDGSDEGQRCGAGGAGIPGQEAILLKTYPDRQSIKQSREVVFQCRDEGRLRSAVRWSRPDNQVMPRGYSDQRGRLTIPNIQMADAGIYYCEAVGVAPNTPGYRRTVTLEVLPFASAVTTPAPAACSAFEATCMNGECIPKSAVCDGDADCTDASDEMRCSPLGCEPNEFQCDNKRCVLKTWICDSDNDCGDSSDERNCGPPKPGDQCQIHEFACQTMNQCIPKSFHCDGEVDCSDLTDELGCARPIFTEPPPRTYSVEVTQTFVLTCRAVGIPTPTVIWRLNWGHVPDKCSMTSDDGYGVLTCPDARPTDQGAYSCEAINIKGSVFAIPDTIVVVTGGAESVCNPPLFNAAASSATECLECFCFGAATECFSTDRYVSQLPPPSSGTFELVGVNQDQVQGKYVIRDSQYPLQSRYVSTNYLGSAELEVPDRTRLGGPSDLLVFFSLPSSHRGSKLMSYGGYLRYKIMYSGTGAGQPVNGPDVIIRGNGLTLMHVHDGTLLPDTDNQVDVRFWPGQWFKTVILSNNRLQSLEVASREEILMALEDVELLLIRALYVDTLIVSAKLSDVQLDTAVIGETAQGRAVYVEECRCPQGYTGLSCEDCAPNFRRAPGGRWLGRCVPDVECRPGEYGDPANNIPCLPCPCPLTNYPNQFGRSCYLDTDGQVTCNCPTGYDGRRCESCTVGFEGNPTVAGDYCKPAGECNPAGSKTATVDPRTGQCQCKEFTTGPKCDQCKDSSFYLNQNSLHGCIQCFCMGTTDTCASSNLYRTQETINFQGRSNHGVALVSRGEGQEKVITDLSPNDRGELVYRNFDRQGELFYWRLPAQFLGNKVTSYGGDLIFTLRYMPSPGGSSSKNNAYVVELNGNGVTLHYYDRQQQLASNQPERVVVPLYENYWHRQDNQSVNREYMLIALARINYILIKATYTTTTSEVGLQSVSMDIAVERNTGGPRAGAVEQCSCPVGYKGLSCEECAPGFTRGTSGVYLGVCVHCSENCNGHSEECDPDTTECINCRDNTAGFTCEECLPGYTMDPNSRSCIRTGPDCSCDRRGSLSDQCVAGTCQCKEGVQGDNCNLCRPGFFDLSEDNPQGCSRCWCSGVTDQCFASNFHRMEIPMNLIGEDHGFVITNRARMDVKRDGLRVNIKDNEISFSEFNLLNDQDTYYWSLPQAFTGNLLPSYGGNLSVTQQYESGSSSSVLREADVIIRGSNGQEMVWLMREPLARNRYTTYNVPLVETSFSISQYPVTRAEFLQVLSSVEAVLIRATPNTDLSVTTISNIILDTAVSSASPTNLGRATMVEQCRCPDEYRGLSCEDCRPGFYRDSINNRCLRCVCNGHEESCEEGSDGRPKCNCITGYYGDYCEQSGGCITGYPYALGHECWNGEPEVEVEVGHRETSALPGSDLYIIDDELLGQGSGDDILEVPSYSQTNPLIDGLLSVDDEDNREDLNAFLNGFSFDEYDSNSNSLGAVVDSQSSWNSFGGSNYNDALQNSNPIVAGISATGYGEINHETDSAYPQAYDQNSHVYEYNQGVREYDDSGTGHYEGGGNSPWDRIDFGNNDGSYSRGNAEYIRGATVFNVLGTRYNVDDAGRMGSYGSNNRHNPQPNGYNSGQHDFDTVNSGNVHDRNGYIAGGNGYAGQGYGLSQRGNGYNSGSNGYMGGSNNYNGGRNEFVVPSNGYSGGSNGYIAGSNGYNGGSNGYVSGSNSYQSSGYDYRPGNSVHISEHSVHIPRRNSHSPPGYTSQHNGYHAQNTGYDADYGSHGAESDNQDGQGNAFFEAAPIQYHYRT